MVQPSPQNLEKYNKSDLETIFARVRSISEGLENPREQLTKLVNEAIVKKTITPDKFLLCLSCVRRMKKDPGYQEFDPRYKLDEKALKTFQKDIIQLGDFSDEEMPDEEILGNILRAGSLMHDITEVVIDIIAPVSPADDISDRSGFAFSDE